MTKRFTKRNLGDIPIEQAHGGSGSRQVLITSDMLVGSHVEAMTKGYLESGSVFDWHSHDTVDEFFVVLRGEGKFYFEAEVVDYRKGDVVTIPAGGRHKIEATGNETSEYFFVRVKAE
ncbi:MAG: cupin domain-containing protein [Patescibacteria group bacterium]